MFQAGGPEPDDLEEPRPALDIKTVRLYEDEMKLLNIRLDPDDLARVRALRARGVKLSHLLREAIRAEHDRRTQITRGRNVEEALAEIYAQHRVGEAGERQRFDAHHRRRFRKAVARHVRRRMGR